MKVERILHYIDAFKKHLKTGGELNTYKWECILNFQQRFDADSRDFAASYDQSLRSTISANLWGGTKDSSKSALLELIHENPTFIAATFGDLFNEQLDIMLRLNRFGFHCDQVLSKLQEKNKKINDHAHHDFRILSLYLAFQYPETYTLFDYIPYRKMMEKIESRNIPTEFEVDRFFKTTRAIQKFLIKDEELMEIVTKQLDQPMYYQKPSTMLVHEFYWWCGELDQS